MAKVIRGAWLRKAISQRQVQQDLGIHQSQFSKLVNGQFKETDGHAARLFEYSKQRFGKAQQQVGGSDIERLKSSLTDRLLRAWDGTPEGAKALETILDGAARLGRVTARKG